MYYMRPSRRGIRLVIIISVAALMGACQEPSHQSATEPSSAVLVQATPPAGAAAKAMVARVVGYTPSSRPTKQLANCNLEAVGPVSFGQQPVELRTNQANEFRGWIDGSGLTKPTYWLRFDDASASRYLEARIRLAVQRPDVMSMHTDASLVSGFLLSLPAGSLPDGKYHVYLAAVSSDQFHICDNGRHVNMVS